MTSPLPPETSWVSPYITVTNVDEAVKFYQKAFHFELKNLVPGEDGTGWHAEMHYHKQLIMCGKQGTYGSQTKSPLSSGVESPITLYIYCEDVDQFYQDAVINGAQGIAEPEDMFWGDRMCRLMDLDNYIWCFATYKPEAKKV